MINTILYEGILCPVIKQYDDDFNDCYQILYKNNRQISFFNLLYKKSGDVLYIGKIDNSNYHIFHFYLNNPEKYCFRRSSSSFSAIEISNDYKIFNPGCMPLSC